jgi:pimeloyl-ACP methyl ester carboxylesterase
MDRATLRRMLVDIRPVSEGTIERDGVRIGFQVFGGGPRSLLLLPTWPIVHSDFWRAQVPHLMSRYRVVTFDGRGNGASDRPVEVASYTGAVMVADTLAVLDAVEVDRAAVLSVSLGAPWAALLAVNHPDRVAASAFIAPYLPLGPQTEERAAAEASFDTPRPRYDGWQKWNRHYWHEDWPGFLEFFFSRCFTEPDSRPNIDHFIEMGLQTTPTVMALTEDADDLDEAMAHDLARAIPCPSLVIHGDEDAIAPVSWGLALARIAGAELHVIRGGGHEPELREPDATNRLLDVFLQRVWPPAE